MDTIFENYGIEIYKDNQKYYIGYEDGEIATVWKKIEVSKEDADKAQLSEKDAYEVIIKYQNIQMGLV